MTERERAFADAIGTLARLFEESVTATKKARARAERAEAEAALMRVALQSLRRRIDDIIQAATTEHRDLYWLDDGVTQMVKADADAALASDAGRALLERVRKLERTANRLLELLYHGHATLTVDADEAAQELRAALEAGDGR